jgi:hypothetical protein
VLLLDQLATLGAPIAASGLTCSGHYHSDWLVATEAVRLPMAIGPGEDMWRVVGWNTVLLAIGSVAACGGNSNQSGIAAPSGAPETAPAAALCHQLPSGCSPGSGGGQTHATPAPTSTGTSAVAPSAGASPSPAVVKSCLQQAGFSITEKGALPNQTVVWEISGPSTAFLVDFKTEGDARNEVSYAQARGGVGHLDRIGTYMVQTTEGGAPQVEHCIR